MSAENLGSLRGELDALCNEAGRFIRAARRRSALTRGLRCAVPTLLWVPAAWLAIVIVSAAASGGAVPQMGWWIVPATLAIPALVVLFALFAASTISVDRRDALATLDKQLGLEDRLVTAEEFLHVEQPTGFEAAALEDAARVAPGARAALLQLEHDLWTPGAREARMVLFSLVLILLPLFLSGQQTSTSSVAGEAPTLVEELAAINARDEASTTRPEPQSREEREQPELLTAPPAKTAATKTNRDKAGELSDETKESQGKTGEGRSSDAESTSGASESRGMPSNQSQKSTAGEKSKKKATKKKPKPPAELKPTQKKEAEENSGSTAGKGSSKGSNKNPAASKWSSKDQVTTQDDQEIEEDEETEDEDDEQESRGGVQPNLRSRKPPVSRDLRIGFGNQKNPDANGRGGPSEAKKSRGTASLVLGVPIPDRIKGQPNPGKTKITQERIEPKAEDASTIEASARNARNASVGHLQERELTPWMRTLVREYFLTLRTKNRQP